MRYSQPVPMDSSNRIEGWKPIQKIAIADAVLCVDCDHITEAKNDHCLACGSHSIVHLDRLLRRRTEPESAEKCQK